MDALETFRKRFETYKKIMEEEGEEKAWSTLLEGYPERQRANMGPFILKDTLATAFAKAVPVYKALGMEMEVHDISNNDKDGVIEVQKKCPFLAIAGDYGFDKPCRVICEMDVEATKAAFHDKGMEGGILCTMADGACVCIFKYERPRK